MINAEELGITEEHRRGAKSKSDVMRLVLRRRVWRGPRLPKDWAAHHRHVGNYGEVYGRNVGDGSKLKSRGLNSLWSNGGIQYAPPIDSASSSSTKPAITVTYARR
jgi:general L-amino acid transport system substrate-binding protein